MDTMDNFSNSTDSPVGERPPQRGQPACDLNCLLIVNIIVFIIGIAGNGSIIYITLRHKGLRNIPNLLITNLAVGDLLVIIILVFINILSLTIPAVARHQGGCEIIYFVQFISLGVSVLTLTALSIDRLITVVKPMYRQRHNVKLRTISAVIAIWVISGVLVAPVIYLVHVDPAQRCRLPVGHKSYSIYLIVFFMSFYAIPTMIMITCYTMTARKLMRRSALLNRDSRGGLRQHEQRTRLAIIVLIMTIAFVVCTSLFFLRLLVEQFAPSHPILRNMKLAEAMVFLVKINSCINPVILYLMSSTHRRYFLRHFCCCIAPKMARPRATTNGTYSQVSSNTWLRSTKSGGTKIGMKSTTADDKSPVAANNQDMVGVAKL